MAPPLAAPRFALSDDAAQPPLIDGRPASLMELTKGRSAEQIAQRLRGGSGEGSGSSVAWVRKGRFNPNPNPNPDPEPNPNPNPNQVRKGRFAFVDGCNCSFNAEVRRAG